MLPIFPLFAATLYPTFPTENANYIVIMVNDGLVGFLDFEKKNDFVFTKYEFKKIRLFLYNPFFLYHFVLL